MTKKKEFDAIVVGAGPAGYVAAIRCAQLGLTTACIDDWIEEGAPALGGSCLNVGCIPSKALLESSELYHTLQKESVQRFGIRVDGVRADIPAMIERKERIVKRMTGGIAALFRDNGVEWLAGRGRLLPQCRVEFMPHKGKGATLQGGSVILAPGSRPIEIAPAPLSGERIVSSSGALAWRDAPARLGVIGAGIIGLELGSVWRRLGAETTIIEAQDRFLSMADRRIAAEAQRQFTAQGLDIRLGARVTATQIEGETVQIDYEDGQGQHALTVDRLIVAVGRRPNTEGIAAPEAGLLLDESGCIHVDHACRSNLPGVYAVGDAVRGPMLAHKGSEEGIAVAERIAGHATVDINYAAVPSVIYTLPEIAWVGANEEELKAAGEPFKTGLFPFAANGRAQAMEQAAGLVKILAHPETDRLLGAHIIGPHASELIAQAALTIEFEGGVEDIARTIYPHPTLSEAVREAAMATRGDALHIGRRRRGG